MLLINFNLSPNAAFVQGFTKGLGAPVMLFGNFKAPTMPAVLPVQPASQAPLAAIAGDWNRVGNDIRTAVRSHGQETAAAE